MDLPRNRSVLIVDDDPGIRLLLITFLRGRDFRLLEARNGREALDAMRAGKADLVVLDLMMPGVSGWDVLHQRAADPSMQRIPVIVATACKNHGVTELVPGLDAVVEKPFDLDALLRAMTRCLAYSDAAVVAAA